MKHAKLLLIACAGVVAVTGCGQKGPLVLPDKNAKIITRPAGTRAAQPITPPADATPGQTSPVQEPHDSAPQPPPGSTAQRSTGTGTANAKSGLKDSQSDTPTPR